MSTETVAERGQATETLEAGDFAALLSKEFKPKSERAKEEVESAVRTLAEQVLGKSDIVSEDVAQTINAYIAEMFQATGEKLTRADIWRQAGYKTRSEFERWERCDPKTTKTATERFQKILSEKPHLK